MSKIFITGVAGFLGSHLADAMIEAGHTVAGIDNMIGGSESNIPSRVIFAYADCNDLEFVKKWMKDTDIVYHCAATAYEGLSVFSPGVVTRNIVDASVNVFAAAAENRVKRIVFCSSMARYGAGTPPFWEHHRTQPQDPYGIGKVCAEQMLMNICETHHMDWVIAVPHNIYGPRQKYDDPYRNVASIMMNLMIQGKRPVIYGDGYQRRCFSYIDDCLSCLMQMAFDPKCSKMVINIGPDEDPINIRELYGTIANITGFGGTPQFMPGRPQEVKLAFCSSTVARKVLGYETKTTLREGLSKMYAEMALRGPKPFNYHLPIEIKKSVVQPPKTWTDRLF